MISAENGSKKSDHIRRLDLSKDLDQVADLIERCFPISRDPDGQTYIQEMRKAARDMRMLGWLTNLAEMGSTKTAGFVWTDSGEILGNLSLIPFQKEGRRIHLIANVAVHPDHRRQGIARALTQRALAYLQRRGDRTAWLQVRMDNDAAIDIRWNLPVEFNRFTPGFFQRLVNFLDGMQFKHRAFYLQEELQGVITWQKTNSYANNLWLAFPVDKEAELLPAALARVLKHLNREQPLSIDYPQGRFHQHFDELGFENFRTLIWMRCRLLT